MALQSQLFRGDPKLEGAALSDSAHILPGARGPHVVKIQQALIQVAGAAIVPDGIYGSATAAAVADFKRKQQPQILNFEGKIDNIVGIKTMAALDAGMLPKGSRLLLNVGDLAITFVDIVVNFIGAPGASPRDAEEALPQQLLLNSYDPVQDPFNRKLLRHKSNNNLLLRLAHGTTEIGPRRLTVFNNVIASIQIMLLGTDPSNGNALQPDKIFILGSSSGGRNAIDFVGFLAQFGFRPHFVASIDASFFQADTVDRPIITAEPVEPIPTFTLSAASGPSRGLISLVPNRHNFFQRRGNRAKRVLNPLSNDLFNFLFTSKMGGGLEEIHGIVEGFDNHLIVVKGLIGGTDDDFHDECDVVGRRQAQDMIAKELRGV